MVVRIIISAMLLCLQSSRIYGYSASNVHDTAYKFAHPDVNNPTTFDTIEAALSEIETLREVLRHLLATKEYKAPEPPSFLQQERAETARVEEEEKKQLDRLQQEWEVNAASGTSASSKQKSAPCSHHVSCDACLEAKCGWCIGARRCIDDIPWVCRGDHDHVGTVGKHDTCPTLESVEQARKEREALRESARLASAPASTKDEQDNTQGGKGSSSSKSTLPRGTYDGSCRDCVLSEAERRLMTCICRGPDGNERESELDPSSCDDNTQEIINQNGALACGDMSLTRIEARQRAAERLQQRELEELERVANEMKGGEETKPKKKGKKKTKKQLEEDRVRKESVLRYVERSKAEDTRGSKAPYEALDVERTATQSDIRSAYRRLTLLLHPDKNEADFRDLAETAFREVVAAYEILSNPDKRAAFDDFGGNAEDDGGFETFWEYENSGKKDERSFYTGHRLITQLTEQLWDRRLV
jgi:hypothetical protein